jgi:hypothetical protein
MRARVCECKYDYERYAAAADSANHIRRWDRSMPTLDIHDDVVEKFRTLNIIQDDVLGEEA